MNGGVLPCDLKLDAWNNSQSGFSLISTSPVRALSGMHAGWKSCDVNYSVMAGLKQDVTGGVLTCE